MNVYLIIGRYKEGDMLSMDDEERYALLSAIADRLNGTIDIAYDAIAFQTDYETNGFALALKTDEPKAKVYEVVEGEAPNFDELSAKKANEIGQYDDDERTLKVGRNWNRSSDTIKVGGPFLRSLKVGLKVGLP